MAVIRYFYSAGSLKRVSLFLVLVAALFSLAGPALAGETAPDLQPPLAKKVFTPKYHPIGVMVDEFKKLATPRGKILAIGNDIYVEDEPKAIATMSQTFERLDRVNRYILIEHRVVAVKSDFLEELEVNWEKADHLAFGNLNRAAGRRLDDRLSAAEAVGEARVIYGSPPRRAISSPRITAASGQTVSIKQGRLWGEETSTTVANIELQQVVEKVLKEVVMELKVTPHFEKNNQFIILGIDLRNDAAGAALSGGDHSSDIRRARTMIKDGDTVVIGGLMTDNQTPGSIRRPLLGWLLPDSKAANSEYELLIFITPNIIPISS